MMTEVKIINATCHPAVIKLAWQHLQPGQTNWYPSRRIPVIYCSSICNLSFTVRSHFTPIPHKSACLMLPTSCFYSNPPSSHLVFTSSLLICFSLLTLCFLFFFSDRWNRSYVSRVRGLRWKVILKAHYVLTFVCPHVHVQTCAFHACQSKRLHVFQSTEM